ncbi:hypothetical protein JCM19236_6320 [Vibrio sp. JCM 19236]|nr:hypothetical protein JCM19236_6320 [Vibrio sp. JCM 19236]
MFDYFMIYLWFIAQLKKAIDWMYGNRKTIANHVDNLGIAGYTGSYVYIIQTGFDWKMVVLLVSGVAFTVFAKLLKRE